MPFVHRHLSVLPCFKIPPGELPVEAGDLMFDARSFIFEASRVESGLTAQPVPIVGRVLDNIAFFAATASLVPLTGLWSRWKFVKLSAISCS